MDGSTKSNTALCGRIMTLLDIVSHKLRQVKDEVESILMTSGHYDPADLSPYLEKDNQDQLC